MFSFFAFAQALGRKTSTINTLSLSFIFLLFYNPLYVFQVGFQLSYLAVLSIITIQPKLSSYYTPSNKLAKILWNTTTVTIAAQIGLGPLSIYYFNQFPGLFFITNIIVLPLLGAVLSIGFVVVFLGCFNILPDSMAKIYGGMIAILNDFIAWVAAQDAFLFKEISFPKTFLFISYGVIICLLLVCRKWNFKNLILFLGSCGIALGVLTIMKVYPTPGHLIVFHKYKQTLLGVKQKHQVTLFVPDNITPALASLISSYKTANYNSSIAQEKLPNMFTYKEIPILILDSVGVFPKALQKPVVVLTQNTQIHLARFIDCVSPRCIIADGSNYKSYVDRWMQTCNEKKIPFHSTYEKGAFIWQ
jgi:competence protein ComEC